VGLKLEKIEVLVYKKCVREKQVGLNIHFMADKAQIYKRKNTEG